MQIGILPTSTREAEVLLGRTRDELLGHNLWEKFPDLRRTRSSKLITGA